MSDPEETRSEHRWCEARPGSVATVHTDGDGESISVVKEGHKCTDTADKRVEIETHAGPTMEFDVCEKHAEEWQSEGVVVGVVQTYD